MKNTGKNKSKMRILVIGCGSIGQRHALNAKRLGAQVTLCDINVDRMHEFAKKEGFSSCYADYHEAIRKTMPNAAIVAVPTNHHIQHAIDLASRGIHVFMEKPLAISLRGVSEVERFITKTNVTFMMGHSYRFHEGFLTLKNLLDQKTIGKVYHAQMMSGWYLPDWHIHENYRKGYSARKSLGGGVLLTGMSHMLDATRWLFGEIVEIIGWTAALTDLQIDVEDFASCLLRTNTGSIITLVNDFISRCPRNEIKIIGSEGHISTLLDQHEIHVWKISDRRFLPSDLKLPSKSDKYFQVLEDGVRYDLFPEVVKFNFHHNKRYLDELRYFFYLIEKRITNFDLDISAGKRVLELIERFSDNPRG